MATSPAVTTYIPPQQANSPKDRIVSQPVVIFDGGEDQMACAVMDYHHDADPSKLEVAAVGVRWNGTSSHPVGFPSTHQYPTWLVIDQSLKQVILDHFKARAAGTNPVLASIANLTTEQLVDEINHRGYSVTLSR